MEKVMIFSEKKEKIVSQTRINMSRACWRACLGLNSCLLSVGKTVDGVGVEPLG